MSYLISLKFLLFENIAFDGSFLACCLRLCVRLVIVIVIADVILYLMTYNVLGVT